MVSGQFWVNNHAHVLQARPCLLLPAIVLNGSDLRFSVTGSAQPKLTQVALNKLVVPVPPTAEQHRIVAEVERRFSVTEDLEATVAANLLRAARLRQSIPDRAFRGELVRRVDAR